MKTALFQGNKILIEYEQNSCFEPMQYCINVKTVSDVLNIQDIFSQIADYSRDEIITIKSCESALAAKCIKINTKYLTLAGIRRLLDRTWNPLHRKFKQWAICEMQ
jgi:hypothetical protein